MAAAHKLQEALFEVLAGGDLRHSLMFALDTGSTDSKGSSSTRMRGLWIIAVARHIFLVMPAE